MLLNFQVDYDAKSDRDGLSAFYRNQVINALKAHKNVKKLNP